MIEELWKGKREIAAGTGFSENTTLRLAERGEIPAFKIGATWCMRPTGWREFLQRREEAAVTLPSGEDH